MILFQILLERNVSPVVTYLLSYVHIRLNSHTLIHIFSLIHSRSRSISVDLISEKDDLFKYWKENQRCIEWFLHLI